MTYFIKPVSHSALQDSEEKAPLSLKVALETVVILFALPVLLYFVSRWTLRELGPLVVMQVSLLAAPAFYFLVSVLGVLCILLPCLVSHKFRSRIPLAKKDVWATSMTAGFLAFSLGGATGFLEFYNAYLNHLS